MNSEGSGEMVNKQPSLQENQQCSTYLFPPPVPNIPPGNMSGEPIAVVGQLSATSLTSASRGHARSASHGGVGMSSSSSGTGTPGIITRPSALKQRGHQRAFSQGQIVDSAGFTRGHSRVGSRTDFILPPGHRETEDVPTSVNGAKSTGHSRQASRSESIYTLRRSGPPSVGTQLLNFVLRRNTKDDIDTQFRRITPNHLVPPKTHKKDHPNGKQPNNSIRTTKYTVLSFLPKNLLEQLHRVANVYFICIVVLNWFPAINAFGKEVAMLPVLFVLGVTAIKDLFEDRRRHLSDSRINNSSCRVYKSELGRYTKVLWRDVMVGDLIHLSNNELIPADVLLLRSSNPNGLCYIDTCNLDGETNLKQRQVPRGFVDKQSTFEPSDFHALVEVDRPTTKIYQFHGAIIHPTSETVPVSTDNLLLRDCMLKNTDYIEGIVVYAGHETKAMLNNGGPRYKRSTLERQMNIDVIWCVVILVVLCVVGAVGCKLWLSSYEGLSVPFIPNGSDPTVQGALAFWTYVIILQVMIPLSLYVTMEMAKLLQVYHIHNDIAMYDPETNKRVECRALNIPEEIGQIQYIFSDKTGTLTENKMVFRRCTVGGIDYNHPPPSNAQNMTGLCPDNPLPLLLNPLLLEELRNETKLKTKHSQQIQEFLLVLALCNTVVVSNHPHHDMMNSSGVIEALPAHMEPKQLSSLSPPRNQSYVVKPLPISESDNDRYTRLSESRSVTPSPPQAGTRSAQVPESSPHLAQGDCQSVQVRSSLNLPPNKFSHSSFLSPACASTTITDSSIPSTLRAKHRPHRPQLLNVPPLLEVKHPAHILAPPTTPSPRELKPIFEAESPDELALVNAAYSYNCQLVKRTPESATLLLPSGGTVDFQILNILPFDSTRKCMSIIVKNPITDEITLYCKGADSSILSKLCHLEDTERKAQIYRTQQHLNAYGREGLRVLAMAKRKLSVNEYNEWWQKHTDIELSHDNVERRKRESYSKLERELTLLGATGIEDRLQEGVPETIAALISAGIVIWVLTGDKAETAMNIAMSAQLFTPQMEILKLFARSKHQAETSIMFFRDQIEGESPQDIGGDGDASQVNVFARATVSTESVSTAPPRSVHRHTSKKRALVVDGRTLTYILDPRSNLTKPFLALTQYCCSVLCCRATPLQKSFIVRVVKEELRMRTLAIGDGANDVSMIQAADVGIGISGQEGMQAVMASDFALSRFKYLERFLLVHGHWCYDRLARMVLYFFYKNALFVFLIFWYQLYCGFSGSVMIDQMYLMLYNLMFTSLPPIVIGVYDQDVPEEILLAQPSLFRQGRLGLVYQPHSFWLTMADSLYQSIVIFFIAEGAYHDSEIGIWEFGTTITSACMFVMLTHIAIEIKSWTFIHVASIIASISIYYIFSLVYNTICLQCFGLTSNYWVVQRAMSSPDHWLVIFLVVVMALLPRFVVRGIENCVFPSDAVRTLLDKRKEMQRGEGFLVSWSRSTSTSSIYRTTCTGEFTTKSVNTASLTVVG